MLSTGKCTIRFFPLRPLKSTWNYLNGICTVVIGYSLDIWPATGEEIFLFTMICKECQILHIILNITNYCVCDIVNKNQITKEFQISPFN